jgi:hypothetical protein
VHFEIVAATLPTMYPRVVTKDPTAVELEVQAAYLAMFSRGNRLFVPQVFGWAIDCFTGRHPRFQRVDAGYHDFEHTLQGTLCLARLLHGRHRAGARPQVTRRLFELGVLAILLHDTGYLKRKGDVKGTGAKYTWVHVARGVDFAGQLLKQQGYRASDVKAVQNMIRCTAINASPREISFASERDRVVGYAVGTSDLLGQMAAPDYVDKLPVLYSEFAEAARYDGGKRSSVGVFSNAAELIRQTPAFWEKYVRRKLEENFAGAYRFLNEPYPDGPNYYLQQINANMERLRRKGARL